MPDIKKYVDETNGFFREVAKELKCPGDIRQASKVTAAVLHTVRDRISTDESLHLISILPVILKIIYVESWELPGERIGSDTIKKIPENVINESPAFTGRDFENETSFICQMQAVVKALRMYVPGGRFSDIKLRLRDGQNRFKVA